MSQLAGRFRKQIGVYDRLEGVIEIWCSIKTVNVYGYQFDDASCVYISKIQIYV